MVDKTHLQRLHYGGNSKNLPSNSHKILNTCSKKHLISDYDRSRPTKDLDPNTMNDSYKDVLEGYHKKRHPYRPVQAKDTINYK